jgi:glycerol-3-phosphate dehydrogenase
MEHIIVIGGGVGGAIAHDLALRGFKVTLLEKGALLSGATGGHHGLLHSGARYVLHDVATAAECMHENQILRCLAPQALEQNDGFFIAVSEEDLDFRQTFIANCHQAGIPCEEIPVHVALELEPHLNPALKAALRVPDASMDAWRMAMHFFATARHNGADIRDFAEVKAIVCHRQAVSGVTVYDHRSQTEFDLDGDMIINATGAWAATIGQMVDITIPVQPTPGVMVSVRERVCQMVINRLQPAGQGDIVVPQRGLSIMGTTAFVAEGPENYELPPAHQEQIITSCADLIPKLADLPVHAVWAASRPLMVSRRQSKDPFKSSRGFACLDHARSDKLEGFLSVIGGKATTMRAMAEEVSDTVCAKLGHVRPCRTHKTPLHSYRHFYH